MLPGDAGPARVNAVSGSGQEGTVGTELPRPLVVQVTDASDRPVRNAFVDFLTEVPGAELNPSEGTTDSSGRAEVRVQLGTVEGIQVVEARLAQDAGLRALFSVTAVADDPPDDGRGKGGGKGSGGGRGGGHDDDDDDEDDDDD
jgi:hypothetical protein